MMPIILKMYAVTDMRLGVKIDYFNFTHCVILETALPKHLLSLLNDAI